MSLTRFQIVYHAIRSSDAGAGIPKCRRSCQWGDCRRPILTVLRSRKVAYKLFLPMGRISLGYCSTI
jgi:hypothetical protein